MTFEEQLDEMEMNAGVSPNDEDVSESLSEFGATSTGAFIRSQQPGHLPLNQIPPGSNHSPMTQGQQAPEMVPGGDVNQQLPYDGPLSPYMEAPPNLATSPEAQPKPDARQSMAQLMLGAITKQELSKDYQARSRVPSKKDNPSGY